MASHVLLIEDEPNIAEAIQFLLSRDGLRVSHAAEGVAALAMYLTASSREATEPSWK